MKKIFPVLIFWLGLGLNCKAQYVSLPDTNFVNWLNSHGYSSCLNGNQLDTSCSLVLSASELSCSAADITDFTGIQYFKNIDSLDCCNNNPCATGRPNIIPSFPAKLKHLNCSGDKLPVLPELPNSLQTLQCFSSRIASLPDLPEGLWYLDCSDNNIGSLPALPDSMSWFFCANNQINTLPALPPGLTRLDFSFNYINYLPYIPPRLTYLACGYSNITSLPALPDSLYWLDCSHDTLLECLTNINTIWHFDYSFTAIACMPDYGNVYSATPDINYLALCSVSNPHQCAETTAITPMPQVSPTLQIYPNPFNTNATVQYSLPEASKNANLIISDILGRQINTYKLNEAQGSININALKMKAGIYFCSLVEDGKALVTKKMVVE